VEHLRDETSDLLIVDESGFLKKGEKLVGKWHANTRASRQEVAIIRMILKRLAKEA
jgi:hypothetical protein